VPGVLVEPLGQGVPARSGSAEPLIDSQPSAPAARLRVRLLPRAAAATPSLPARLPLARLVAAGGALTLALSSRGDALVLAAALAVVAARPERVVGVVGALLGSLLRWGTTALGAVAGAQAVLGPAAWTGGGAVVGSALLGAIALLAATPNAFALRGGQLLAAAPFGASAALVALGPGPGGALVLRVVAVVGGTALASLVGQARDRRTASRVLDVVAVVAGVAAAVLGASA
jgi:hypothetical protein